MPFIRDEDHNTSPTTAVALLFERDSGGAVYVTEWATMAELMKAFPEKLGFALSDQTTDLTTGLKLTTRNRGGAFTVTAVYAEVNTAPTGSTLIVDILEAGSTIFSTKLSIDASEKDSSTAASQAVISDASIANNAELTFVIDQVGSSVPGKGLIVWILGYRS